MIDRFETINDVANRVAYLVSHRLPDDHYSRELVRFGSVTSTRISRLASQFLAPWRMTVLIVGDRSRIEPSLKLSSFPRSARLLDATGNPVPRSGRREKAAVTTQPTEGVHGALRPVARLFPG